MNNMNNMNNDDNDINLVVKCPHCKDLILIEEINCAIFRHGILQSNGHQIDPHASKELCDFYIHNNLIIGCGKPFQIIPNKNSKNNNDRFIAIICDYV